MSVLFRRAHDADAVGFILVGYGSRSRKSPSRVAILVEDRLPQHLDRLLMRVIPMQNEFEYRIWVFAGGQRSTHRSPIGLRYAAMPGKDSVRP